MNSNYLATNLYDKMLEIIDEFNVFNSVYTAMHDHDEIVVPIKPFVTASVCFKKNDRFRYFYKQNKIEHDVLNKLNVSSYDLIHAHTLFTDGYVALKMKKRFGIPYIVAIRNTDVNIFFRYLLYLRNVGVEILNHAEKIIFISASYKEQVFLKYIPCELRQSFIRKSVIIPNGIDRFWLQNKYCCKNAPSKTDVKLIYVGRINKNKNITSTMKAIDILQRRGYNIQFTVVGKIENMSVYKHIKNAFYTKHLESMQKDELVEIYRQNDIFIMPSLKETFGLVYAESMSQGLPVIYTRGQGFDKQFNDGFVGYSVDCRNVGDIADKIELVINDYQELSNNCIQNCDKFDWNLISCQYVNIYNEVLL